MENLMIRASLPCSSGSRPDYGNQYEELVAGIVSMAVRDYVDAMRSLWRKDLTLDEKRKLVVVKLEIEEFFHSDWFELLSDLDPDRLMQNCRMLAVEKEKKDIRKQNIRKLKNMKNMKQLRKAAESEEYHNETGQNIN